MNDSDQTLPKSAVEEMEGIISKAGHVHRTLGRKLDSLLWPLSFRLPGLERLQQAEAKGVSLFFDFKIAKGGAVTWLSG